MITNKSLYSVGYIALLMFVRFASRGVGKNVSLNSSTFFSKVDATAS